MKYSTPDFIVRKGIVMHKGLVPHPSVLTFNGGVSRFKDGYVMLFRNDYDICPKDFDDFYAGIADKTVPPTNWGMAFSKDGINFEVTDKPFFEMSGGEVWRTYDPRITAMPDGDYIITLRRIHIMVHAAVSVLHVILKKWSWFLSVLPKTAIWLFSLKK